MSDSVDLRRILEAWPYNAQDDTRLVLGDDGRELLQVRTPAGIEQYEMEGRPDGLRPHGMESALEYQAARLEHAREEGTETEFALTPEECTELFNEGTLYYFRYVRLFQMRDWARTARDTARNLRSFDLIHRYAAREEDRLFLEKWRPYVLRVNATARAMDLLEKKNYDDAIEVVKAAVSAVKGLEELDDETFKFERERSLIALKEMLNQVQRDRPLSELEQLEHQLRRAIERQEFERAARLRDRIRSLKSQPPPQ